MLSTPYAAAGGAGSASGVASVSGPAMAPMMTSMATMYMANPLQQHLATSSSSALSPFLFGPPSSSSAASFPSTSAAPAFASAAAASSSSSSSVQELPSYTNEHMMGTTIMAVSFAGGVVVGADSRTTTGTYIANRASAKIDKIHDRIFCCRSGSAADTQAVSDIVSYYTAAHSIELGRPPLVKTVATLFQDILYQNKDRLLAGIIIGGWDKKNGGQVFVLPLGGALVQQPYALGGSGSTYIYGYVDSTFREGMTKQECQEFVKRGLAHAMARDGSSGGVIRLVTVEESGTETTFIPGDQLPYAAERF